MNVLIHATEAEVVHDLLTVTAAVPRSVLTGRVVQKLRDEKGTGETEALWAVETWLLAFELITKQQITNSVTAHESSTAKVAEQGSSTQEPDRKPGEIITNTLGMKFAWIPPGTFLMGSPKTEAERSDNEIQHTVPLSRGFYMGVHLVTQIRRVRRAGRHGRSVRRTHLSAGPERQERRKIADKIGWAIVGETLPAVAAKQRIPCKYLSCKGFRNNPAWIRTRTKRAKIHWADAPGVEKTKARAIFQNPLPFPCRPTRNWPAWWTPGRHCPMLFARAFSP